MRRFEPLARVFASVLLVFILCRPASAQDVPPLEEIEQSYRVVELSRGWVLQPVYGDDFETLEIIDGRVTIDGSEVSESDLRRFVDEDAAWILALAQGASPAREETSPPAPEAPPQPPEVEGFEPEIEEAEVQVDEGEERRSRRRYRNRRDTQVSFGSGMTIEEDESVREVVVLSGPLTVKGEVDGDATVVMGSADITGRVDGSLVVVGGSVFLGSEAIIDGDVVAVGGGIHREPGAEVDGEITQVGLGDTIDVGDVRIDIGSPGWFWPSFEIFGFSWFDLLGRIFGFLLITFSLLALVFIAPRKVAGVADRVRGEPWKSGLVGLAIAVLIIPAFALVCVLLAISIVGIPLLVFLVIFGVPLLIFAVVIYLLLGLAGVSTAIGRGFRNRFHLANAGKYSLLLIGLVFLFGWSILGEALSATPWPLRLVAVFFLLLGFSLKVLAGLIGFGGALLEQFSSSNATTVDQRWPGSSGTPGGAGALGGAGTPGGAATLGGAGALGGAEPVGREDVPWGLPTDVEDSQAASPDSGLIAPRDESTSEQTEDDSPTEQKETPKGES